jgi:hypothetical protein
MADVKISQLPAATTPLAGTEEIPLVQSTTTKKVTVSGLLTTANLGTPTAINLTNATSVPVNQATGVLPVVNGGTGVTTPNIIGGTNISVTGTWPNQTVSATGSASGNVTGPVSSTDNAVARYDNTTGQIIQNSSVIINDAGEITAGTWNGTAIAVAYGGTGTATPSIVAGTNVTVTGTWPNQTINSTAGGSGTVTDMSIVSANGLAGTVATSTTTPAVTLSTTVTGVVKGNGTALSAATAGTDYVAPGGALGTPSSGTATNLTGLPLTTGVTGLLPVANGGTGTATPALVAGTNVTISGSWPNQTINATGGGGGSGTVTDVSVVSANGLAGTVANSTTTPAITLSTSVTGVLKGNGTALSAATAGTDYVAPGGALGTPSSGTLTNCTFPTLNQNTTGSAGSVANALTAGTGISFSSGTTYNGSAAITINNSGVAAYPGAGIPNSTGSAWGTSYTTTGSGTVVALATSPSLTTPILGTPTSGDFSTGSFTWPTFNQNTTGTAAGLSATLAVTSGGTGQTSYTDGQLLIGNSTGNTLTKATLTAGTGITVTNASGSITIASSGGGGTSLGLVKAIAVNCILC